MKNWDKIIDKEDKKIEKLEKATARALEKSEKKEIRRALKDFEKIADKGLFGGGF